MNKKSLFHISKRDTLPWYTNVAIRGGAIILALVPNFHGIAPFSWLIGAGIAGMLYLIIAKRQPHYADVNGEAIAVDNVSH